MFLNVLTIKSCSTLLKGFTNLRKNVHFTCLNITGITKMVDKYTKLLLEMQTETPRKEDIV